METALHKKFLSARSRGFAARCEARLCLAGRPFFFNGGLCPRFGLSPQRLQAKGRTRGIAQNL